MQRTMNLEGTIRMIMSESGMNGSFAGFGSERVWSVQIQKDVRASERLKPEATSDSKH
jgi:hypothetical protein